jgi:hypothetical protein
MVKQKARLKFKFLNYLELYAGMWVEKAESRVYPIFILFLPHFQVA